MVAKGEGGPWEEEGVRERLVVGGVRGGYGNTDNTKESGFLMESMSPKSGPKDGGPNRSVVVNFA